MDRISRKDGFTLVEILVATSIFAILSGAMALFFINGSNVSLLISNQSDLHSIGSNAMTYMTQELRNATLASTGSPPNIYIPPPPNNNSITFYLPKDLDALYKNGWVSDSIWDTANAIQYQYIAASRQLRRIQQGVSRVIATDVSSIQFEDKDIDSSLGDNALRITMTLSRLLLQGRTTSVTLTSIVKLKNQ